MNGGNNMSTISEGIPNKTKERMTSINNLKKEEVEEVLKSIKKEAQKIVNDDNLNSHWAFSQAMKILDYVMQLKGLESNIELLTIYSKPNEEEGKSNK